MSALLEIVLVPAESIMNRGITMSQPATRAARQLENRSMRVSSRSPDIDLRISVVNGRLRLRPGATGDADVELQGSALELNRLLFVDGRAPVREGRVSIKGSAETAERFRELFRLAGPEPEQQLASLIGGPAAFQVRTAAQSVFHWLTGVTELSADHLSDILQEDSDLLPAPDEVDQFNAGVDEARDRLARIEARINRLAKAVDSGASDRP